MTEQAITNLDADAAFAHKGAQAAVFRPRFGQAHQQYFTPRWLCQACADIAEKLFDVPVVQDQRGGYPLRVIDPTCGSGRLLAPFAQRGHQVLGIELDDRLVPVARRAVGKDHVRKGDVCAYAPAIPTERWDVAVINPPYGLWWPVTDTPLASTSWPPAENIESQNLVLELATRLLCPRLRPGWPADGHAVGRFWNVYPRPPSTSSATTRWWPRSTCPSCSSPSTASTWMPPSWSPSASTRIERRCPRR